MASATFPPAVGGDGSTVTDDANPQTGLKRAGYQTRLIPALSNTVSVANFTKTKAEEALASRTAAAASAAEAKTSELLAAGHANAAAQMTTAFDTLRPKVRPSLNLDFVNQEFVDRRVVVNRNGPKTYFGNRKVLGDENLLRYSEDFLNAAWTQFGGLVRSANTEVAPDGTLTADTLTDNSTTAFAGISQTVSVNQSLFFSIYVKQTPVGEPLKLLQLLPPSGGILIYEALFLDTGTGVVTPVANLNGDKAYVEPESFGVELVNGFYRIWIKHNSAWFSGALRFEFYPAVSANGLVDNNGVTQVGSAVIWGAQVETAHEGQTKPSAYVRTTDYPVRTFFTPLEIAPANVMPIEYDPVSGECLGVKPESAATNLVTFSEQFENSTWAKSAITVLPNSAVAPDGQITADTLIPGTGNNVKHVSRSITLTANSFVFSCYFKAAGYRYAYLFVVTGGTTQIAEGRFDLELGVSSFASITGPAFTNFGTKIESVGAGWYRCTLFGIGNSPLTSQFITCNPNSLGNAPNSPFIGNGYSGVHIWGAQLEASSLGTASSYVPTTSAQVTRLADNLQVLLSDFRFNFEEGTIFLEIDRKAADKGATQHYVDIGDGSPSHLIELYNLGNTDNLTSGTTTSGVSQGVFSRPVPPAGLVRVVYSFSKDNALLVINGGTAILDSTYAVPELVTRLFIGQRYSLNEQINNHIRSLRYYPKALTAAESQALSQI